MLNVRIIKWLWTASAIFSGNSEAVALTVFSVDITNLQEYKTGLRCTHVCGPVVRNGQSENELRQCRAPATPQQTVLGESVSIGRKMRLDSISHCIWSTTQNLLEQNIKTGTPNLLVKHTRACTHACTQAYTHTWTQRHMHTHTYACMHLCTHALMHAHRHAHTHAHRHLPMHIHMCMRGGNEARLSDVAVSLCLL